MMDIEKAKTCCFTGHRPEKLPDNGNENSVVIKALKSRLFLETKNAVAQGYKYFITGMQRGVDLWAGECVLDLMGENDIHLIAAIPYKDFGKNYQAQDKWLFGRITDSADKIVYISEKYTKDCYKQRNLYMIENSSMLIAVVDDYNSGSGQTIGLAKKNGLIIKNILIHGNENDQCTFV
ncbi:MAG: DUF1273 family protein [Oscillospiraceae bacterium]|nr:DUF1273 family protein [Oscillospiraceae bacterium]